MGFCVFSCLEFGLLVKVRTLVQVHPVSSSSTLLLQEFAQGLHVVCHSPGPSSPHPPQAKWDHHGHAHPSHAHPSHSYGHHSHAAHAHGHTHPAAHHAPPVGGRGLLLCWQGGGGGRKELREMQ